MHSSLLPKDQKWLIDRCRTLDFDSNETGICKGYGYMAMQAFLANDVPAFMRRLELINAIPVEYFKEYYDEIKRKRIEFIADIKSNSNIMFDNLNNNDIHKIEIDPVISSALEKIRNYINQSNNITIESEQSFVKRKTDWIRNAFIQNMIQEAINKMELDERISFDIPIFFEGIERCHKTMINENLFGKLGNSEKQLELSLSLVSPVDLEKSGGITLIDSFTGIYNIFKFDLYQYFNSLSVFGRNIDNRFALCLYSSDHFICIGCEPFLGLHYQVFNSNIPELSRSFIKNEDQIAELVVSAFSETNITTFRTCIYSTNDNADTMHQLAIKWKSTAWYKSHHTITPQNAKLTDFYNASWLHIASFAGENITVEELLIQGADPNLSTILLKNTPLHDACLGGHLQMVKFLLNHNAEPNVINNKGNTPLSMAVTSGFSEIADTLIQYHADPNLFPGTLCSAVLNQDLEMVKSLLAAKANPNIQSKNDDNPLHIAVLTGNLEMVQILLNYQAKPDCLNAFMETPLYLACMGRFLSIVSKLIKAGADPNLSKISILIPACQSGDAEIVSEILSSVKINPDAIQGGHSALYYAAEQGNYIICQLLLAHGADPNLIPTSPSPLFIASQMGYEDVVCLLLEHPRTNAMLPLHTDSKSLHQFGAFMHVESAIEKFLKNRNLDENSTSFTISPVEIAEVMGHEKIANLICDNLIASTVSMEINNYINGKISLDKINISEKLAWHALQMMLTKPDNDNYTVNDIFEKWKDISSDNEKTYLKILVPEESKLGLFSNKNVSSNAIILNNILKEYHDKFPQQPTMISCLRRYT